MSEHILTLQDSTFEKDVLQAGKPVLVDFWAEWCNPCKMLAPILNEIATTYNDQLIVGKINIDDNPETPTKYAVRGIPTLMLFENGNLKATKVGALTKQQLAAFIDNHI